MLDFDLFTPTCEICGAVVRDGEKHQTFHDGVSAAVERLVELSGATVTGDQRAALQAAVGRLNTPV